MDRKVYVTLENGKVFEGYSFGAEKEVIGELVFTTGMVGYLETITDSCYYGQIVAQTFPLMGNYGVIAEDCKDKKCHLTAYLVREKCDVPSNFRCTGTLEEYLKEQGIPAVYGIDTRELTRIVRETGVMAAAITFAPVTDFAPLRRYEIANAVQAVACGTVKRYGKEGGCKVVAYNFGDITAIANELVFRGCEVIEVPADTSAEEVLKYDPDGVLLSGGPGDPAENAKAIEAMRALAGKLPVFGIGLGHQIFALATGATTRKMKYGHRGGNQPVKEVKSGNVFISAQNHGYEVLSDSVTEGVVSYINVNDGTCEGIDYPQMDSFTVQFFPAVCGGPHSAYGLFDKFVETMKKVK